MYRFPTALLLVAMATSLVACEPAEETDDTSHDEAEMLIRQVYDAFESGETTVLDSIMAEDFVEHEALPGLSSGREGVKEFMSMWRSAFPDFQIEVHRVLVDGDMAAAHATFRGTQHGEFLGVAPTGRQIAVPTVDIIRFEGGRAVEHWGVTNEAVMLRQLGLIPDEAAPDGAAPEATAPADTAR